MLFRSLYEYTLAEVRAKHFDEARKILAGLRDAWQQAFARTAEPAGVGG